MSPHPDDCHEARDFQLAPEADGGHFVLDFGDGRWVRLDRATTGALVDALSLALRCTISIEATPPAGARENQ
jgi:phage baseplate assembly protein gpV